MADHGYAAEERGPHRGFTPSIDSEEEMGIRSSSPLSDRDYRLFNFRKEGRSWAKHLCSESTLSETEIKKRARRTKKHSVEHQLDKMSLPRRLAIEDLLENTYRQDPDGDRWELVAIDNDKPQWTKRTGEVLAFSVILARIAPSRQRTSSMSQDRRRSSTYRVSPTREYAVPTRRGSTSYNTTRRSPARDRERQREDRSARQSQTILEDDPFGNANLFSNDGKPINPQGSAPFTNGGLPPHIPQDEPIGTKPEIQKNKQDKKDKNNKSKKSKQDDGIIDLDELLGAAKLVDDDDLLVENPIDDEHQHYDLESPIQIIGEHDDPHHGGGRSRGRKRADSGWGEKTPKHGRSRSRSRSKSRQKSKPRRLSIHIPRDSYDKPIQEITSTAAGRRRQNMYWGSHGSATTPSIHSDQSVLEAEYEDYSSSVSSGGAYDELGYRTGGYSYPDGRYPRATRDHRRGPPSPQLARYETPVEPVSYSLRRRPRSERYASDGAITRYGQPPSSARPLLVTQLSAPRFTPMSAHPATSSYNYDTGLVPYPHEQTSERDRDKYGRRRRDSLQAVEAQLYMASQGHTAREIELLKWERDIALREAELHQEVARRATVSVGPSGGRERQRDGEDGGRRERGTSKYTHEPGTRERRERREQGYSVSEGYGTYHT